ncbi:hypothetical protein A3850_003670 [Lewinella sp. 4G2]|nr:hypothetical protein A3850_003670 [Lewinella sp. 4G2]
MALALLGVIFLQINLIRTGMEVNEQRYDEALQDALNKVARELEIRELAKFNALTNGYSSRDLPSSIGGGELSRPLQRPGLLGGTGSLADLTPAQILFYATDLDERIDRESMDKELRTEFANADLKGDIEYGVYDAKKEEFIIRNGRRLSEMGSDTARHIDLLRSSNRVPLYDVDGETPGYLMAYSPRKDSVILNTILNNLLASLLFIAIILGCFVYTIYVILFQKKLSEMKTDFINNMTHEFKTPIATISLATDSINSPKVSGDPEKVRRFARIIKQENKRMNDQVEKVLQMAKLDKNKLNLNLTEVDVNDLVIEAGEYIRLQVEPREGSVVVLADADPSTIQADETHIASLINNLLDNANKYSPEAPEIIVSTRNVASGIEITIQDHGLGMSREARKNIFDRFYRVHTGDRHDVKGFGLGLSYVKTITEVHGGSIQVKSELGKGSSFIVTLPYTQNL